MNKIKRNALKKTIKQFFNSDRIIMIALIGAPIIGVVLCLVFFKSESTSTIEWLIMSVACGVLSGWLGLFVICLLIVLIFGIISGLATLISNIKNHKYLNEFRDLYNKNKEAEEKNFKE